MMDYYQSLAHHAGFRLAENTVANPGFYWRPDDDLNFSPVAVFPTKDEAWRHCCEFNDLDGDDESTEDQEIAAMDLVRRMARLQSPNTANPESELEAFAAFIREARDIVSS